MEDCLQKAKQYYNSEDYQNAQKWAEKSYNIQKNPQAEKIIKLCQKKQPQSSHTQQSTQQSTSTPSYEQNYTQEQQQNVNKIIQMKNYYDILQIKSDANIDEIKRSYKKMALKLHPDKNKAPKATEAFRLVAKAYDCLSDENKRAHYDRYGEEEPMQQRHSSQHFAQEEFDPEQIFNFFFNGGGQMNQNDRFQNGGFFQYQFNNNQRFQQQRRPNQRHQQQDKQGVNYIHVILLFIALFYFNGLNDGKIYQYSMHRNSYYTNLKKTSNLDVQYFVHKDLDKQSDRNYYYKEFEMNIEKTYMQKLYEQCRQERYNKEWLENKAKYYSGKQQEQYIEMANKVSTSSCNLYENSKLKIR